MHNNRIILYLVLFEMLYKCIDTRIVFSFSLYWINSLLWSEFRLIYLKHCAPEFCYWAWTFLLVFFFFKFFFIVAMAVNHLINLNCSYQCYIVSKNRDPETAFKILFITCVFLCIISSNSLIIFTLKAFKNRICG